jgi:hypothetical protein
MRGNERENERNKKCNENERGRGPRKGNELFAKKHRPGM